MTTPRTSQFVSVALSAPGSPNIRASQLALVSLVQLPNPKVRASQVAIISVVANNKKILSLGPAIKLPCWQPCTAYGTRAIVIRFK